MWVLRYKDTILHSHKNKADVTVEAFMRHLVVQHRGHDGKRHLRLQYGYKIEELTEDAYRAIQERNQATEHQQTYVRSEEGGRIGRVVQSGPKTDSGDS